MKILFTGGGTGGHFYPIIAIAEQLNQIIEEEKILKAELYFMSDSEYDKAELFKHGIVFQKVSAGKLRLSFSLINFFDYIKIFFGVIEALFQVYNIFPDVVIAKGGYASFPALFAAKLLKIPVIIHESDSVPGRVNKWASKFAKRIAISYPEAIDYFPKEKTALIGQPIRQEIIQPSKEGVFEYLNLNESIPVIVVYGGSQGAEIINNVILEALPELLNKYQIIHQVGSKNLEDIKERLLVILKDHPNQDRYKIFGFLNTLAVKMAAGAGKLVISRSGSTIFEIAIWGLPSIIVPISKSNGDHQRKNAYSYARTGSCIVLEENNFSSHVLIEEINRIMENKEIFQKMSQATQSFVSQDAAKKIARQIIDIALEHE